MHSTHSRRNFLTTLSVAGAACILGPRRSLADEGPPEVTTIRLRRDPAICLGPWDIAEDLLRVEGIHGYSLRARTGRPGVDADDRAR